VQLLDFPLALILALAPALAASYGVVLGVTGIALRKVGNAVVAGLAGGFLSVAIGAGYLFASA